MSTDVFGANTAVGAQALMNSTGGPLNTAIGAGAMSLTTGGAYNTAVGAGALSQSLSINNTAVGVSALHNTTTGQANVAIGSSAGFNLTTGLCNIDIGAFVAGQSDDDRTIRIGTIGFGSSQTRCFIGGIRGVTTGNGNAIPVLIDSAGQLGTVSSSRRFKNEIRAMDKSSESILALKPVTFHYKSDTKDTPQFGLIAEDVAAVNPDLVVRDEKGEIYTVRYDAVNAMLLNEFLKAHYKIEEQQTIIEQLRSGAANQETTISELKKDMGVLTAQLREQASQIQKVSSQLQMSNTARQMVASQ
jgi:hypothetical protein